MIDFGGNMKKFISILLAAIMLISLFSCGKGNENAPEDTTVADTTAKDTTEKNEEGAKDSQIDFSTVMVRGYRYAYIGEECEAFKIAEGADHYESSKPSVATVSEDGKVTPVSEGVTLIGYVKDGAAKSYVVCVFAEDGGPDRSAGEAQLFESGDTFFHTAVVGNAEYSTSNEDVVDVTEAPTLKFKNTGYAAVTAANISRPFVYSFIVYDRTVE